MKNTRRKFAKLELIFESLPKPSSNPNLLLLQRMDVVDDHVLSALMYN